MPKRHPAFLFLRPIVDFYQGWAILRAFVIEEGNSIEELGSLVGLGEIDATIGRGAEVRAPIKIHLGTAIAEYSLCSPKDC
jgi:hypothetical protein